MVSKFSRLGVIAGLASLLNFGCPQGTNTDSNSDLNGNYNSAPTNHDTPNPPTYQHIEVSAGNDITLNLGDCTTLNGSISRGKPPYVSDWTAEHGSFPDNQNRITVCPTQTTTYTFTARDAQGIQDMDKVVVNVRNPGIGVDGFGDLEQIFQRNDVLHDISAMREKYVFITPQMGTNPPSVEGGYNMVTKQLWPQEEQEIETALLWNNRNGNFIRTATEGNLTGPVSGRFHSEPVGSGIIRGEGNSFSVYSVQDTKMSTSFVEFNVRSLLVLNGEKTTGGYISGNYFEMPISCERPDIFSPISAAGVFSLKPTYRNNFVISDYDDVNLTEIFTSLGYETGGAWPVYQPIPDDVFAPQNIVLSGMNAGVYYYCSHPGYPGSDPNGRAPLGTFFSGEVISGFSQIGGSLNNVHILNFPNPVHYCKVYLSDNNANVSTHNLYAFSDSDAKGTLLDVYTITDPPSGESGVMQMQVESAVPIKSVWTQSFPYGANSTDHIVLGY